MIETRFWPVGSVVKPKLLCLLHIHCYMKHTWNLTKNKAKREMSDVTGKTLLNPSLVRSHS